MRRRDEIATFEVAAETLGECGDLALFCFDKPYFWAPAARVAAAAYALGRDGSYKIQAAAVARTVLSRAGSHGADPRLRRRSRRNDTQIGARCARQRMR